MGRWVGGRAARVLLGCLLDSCLLGCVCMGAWVHGWLGDRPASVLKMVIQVGSSQAAKAGRPAVKQPGCVTYALCLLLLLR